MTIISDRWLSQKLELTEARANADFVETRARLQPDSGVEWIEVAGARAMFDGPESPLTQTFGLGLFDEVTGHHFEKLERFFTDRGAPIFHEVSPLADPSLLQLLGERGYRPIELTSVMYQSLDAGVDGGPPANDRISTRVVSSGEADLWARTSAAAWSTEMPVLADFMLQFGLVSAQCAGACPYLAELDGEPVATGMLFIYEDIAILAGASTVPTSRRQGAQGALLKARLRHAREQGCTLAMMGAAPGSQSQKNAQKNGFSIAYTRIKWQLFGQV